jgi:hypothetical protein
MPFESKQIHFMRNIFYLVLSFVALTSCNTQTDANYFKLTFTDQANPIGLLPECIEVGSNGKLVILTNRFNDGDEIYQKSYFIELHKQQLDSIKMLIENLQILVNTTNYDAAFNYKVRLDLMPNNKRESHIYMARNNDNQFKELIEYCKSLPEKNKRYTLKHSYYFNTDEICLVQNGE